MGRMKKVCSPIQIGSMTVKNRFVAPAMDTSTTTKDHLFSKQTIEFLAGKAKGGFGLVVTEFVAIDKTGFATSSEAGIYDDSFISNLSEVVSAIHRENGKCAVQLHHAGIQTKSANIGGEMPLAVSKIPCRKHQEEVREMTNAEIYEYIDKYADAAVRAKKAGFDAVEVHATHGYQINQFLSKHTNKRVDEFGGTIGNRARFACEVIQRIKMKCGSDYPVLIRMNGYEHVKDGNTIDDIVTMARLFEAAGVDCLDVSAGTAHSGYIVTPYQVPQGFNMNNVKRIKDSVNVPVIGVGRITDPDMAETLLETGHADLIALGRQSVADPEFPNKVYAGKEEEIIHCVGCLQRCYYAKGYDEQDTGISCMLNPFVNKETIWKIERTKVSKQISIIGAGPAGLEAAWILGKKGHKVSVYDKAANNGGQYCLASVPSQKSDLAQTIFTYTTLGKKFGVKYVNNCKVNQEFLNNLDTDIIILATGSQPIMPSIPGIEGENSISALDVLSGQEVLANKNLLIIGGGLVGCETAEFLQLYNNKVTIVDMIKDFAPGLQRMARANLLETLEEGKAVMRPETKVLEFFEDGVAYIDQNGKGELRGFDKMILAIGAESYNPLEAAAKSLDKEVYVIGDAKFGRDARAAIYEGAKLAVEL